MTSLQAPLNITGEVEALIADKTVLVRAKGDVITIDIPTIRVGIMALRGAGRRKQRTRMLSGADSALRFALLTVDFRLAGGTVAKLGNGARPGLLSHLLGLAPLGVKLSALVPVLRCSNSDPI